MKLLRAASLTALVIAFGSASAFAVPFKVYGTGGPTAGYDAYWQSGAWDGASSEDFYKATPGEAEKGPYAGVFSTSWQMPKEAGEYMLAVITWTSGVTFDLTSIWLKAGTGATAWFAFDPADFDSSVHTSIELYAPGKKAISNIGLKGEFRRVPDSTSTFALLGLGIGALALIARRRKG